MSVLESIYEGKNMAKENKSGQKQNELEPLCTQPAHALKSTTVLQTVALEKQTVNRIDNIKKFVGLAQAYWNRDVK